MRFRVLGPLRVLSGGQWCAVRADHQRLVLSLLLVCEGRCVRTDRLIDEIWGVSPPRTARNTIQAYMARLRRAIDAGSGQSALVTIGPGYRLAIPDTDLDACLFDRLVAQGKRFAAAGDPRQAVARLSEALALWQGPAFADVRESPTIAAETTRLDLARLSALEAKLCAELTLGRHAEVVDELATLVDENPLREQLRLQLMLALYRCGRRAEALAAYRAGRRVLVDELGIEPGRALRELEQTILRDESTWGQR